MFIHSSSYIDKDVEIGENTYIWHFCHIMKGAKIGKNCTIGQNVFIGKNVLIGDGCKIQNNVSIFEGVNIHHDVFIGPSVVFTNVINPRAFIERKEEFKKTIVYKGVSIGANATILCGISIGLYAAIGAGSVILKNVAAWELVAGNPAKYIKHINREWTNINVR